MWKTHNWLSPNRLACVFQIHKAMPRPLVTICSHRHVNLLDLAELTHAMSNRKPLDIPWKEPISDHTRAMLYVQGLLSNLKKLNNILSRAKSSTLSNDMDLLANWSHVRCVMRKQTLRSLSLPRPTFFWYDTDFLEFKSFDFIDHTQSTSPYW